MIESIFCLCIAVYLIRLARDIQLELEKKGT
jgi:hypothetical protein